MKMRIASAILLLTSMNWAQAGIITLNTGANVSCLSGLGNYFPEPNDRNNYIRTDITGTGKIRMQSEYIVSDGNGLNNTITPSQGEIFYWEGVSRNAAGTTSLIQFSGQMSDLVYIGEKNLLGGLL